MNYRLGHRDGSRNHELQSRAQIYVSGRHCSQIPGVRFNRMILVNVGKVETKG